MIISHTYKFIFIKSKKTAGTSVEAAISNHCSGTDIVTPLGNYRHNRGRDSEWVHRSMNAGDFEQHDDYLTIKRKLSRDIWDTYFKFSIARNPWDRVVSLFTWENRNKLKARDNHPLQFFKRLSDVFGTTRDSFSEFVKSDWTNNDHYYLIDSEICVDFIILYETLAEDLQEVCDRIGIEKIILPHLKSGFRDDRHYSEYYDQQSKEIVADRHKNDIRLFGYHFENL